MEAINLYNDLWLPLISQVNWNQGGFIRPQTNFQQWVNEVSDELFREKVSEFQRSQRITDDLYPFLKSINATATAQPGKNYAIVAFPEDYESFSSARVMLPGNDDNASCGCVVDNKDMQLLDKNGKCLNYVDPDYAAIRRQNQGSDLCEYEISAVDNQKWGAACNHAFKKPTIRKPVLTQNAAGFMVIPKNIGFIVLDYFKVPRKAVFSYTVDGSDNIVYDPATSVQLEWPRTVKTEFLNRLLKKYGIYIREPYLYQAGNNEQAQEA